MITSDLELALDLNLVECPFLSSCILPKIPFLCKIPECKNCPDYVYKLGKMK